MPQPRIISKYKEGEAVLCFQGILIYEAKVQTVQKDGVTYLYDIHYKGWNKTWDETVPEERLLKLTPENLQKQKYIQQLVKKKKSTVASGTVAAVLSPEPEQHVQTPKEPPPPPPQVVKKKKLAVIQPGPSLEQPQVSTAGIKRSFDQSDCKIKEVRLNVKRLKKFKSRSNSESSSISVQSNRSSEDDVSTKFRIVATELKKRPQRIVATLPKIEAEILKVVKKSHPRKKSINSNSAKSKSNLHHGAKLKVADSYVYSKIPFGKELIIELPEELKSLLVDDFDLISRQRKTLMVPGRLSVTNLLDSFCEEVKRSSGGRGKSSKVTGVEDVCQGLTQYFNATLGTRLLYKFERVQYSDILKEHPGVPMSKLYGPIHLLRLLTNLGSVLTISSLPPHALSSLLTVLDSLVLSLLARKDQLFARRDYGTASPEYHRRAL